MALHWNELSQNIAPNTELTYTTAVVHPGTAGFRLPAAEKVQDPPDGNRMLVPGGIDGTAGFIDYWNEYFSDTPFADYTGPSAEDRGLSYLDFAVPPSQEMNVEWAEVKVEISGDAAGLDGLRLMLVSPNGTQSELNNYYPSPGFTPYSSQPSSTPANGWSIDPAGDINPLEGNFVWTFSTNRSWGESSNSTVLIHSVTGEPVLQEVDTFDPDTSTLTTTQEPIFRNWELHIENWSEVELHLLSVEVVWHGKPIAGGQYDPNYADNGILGASAFRASSESTPTATIFSTLIATCRRLPASMPT